MKQTYYLFTIIFVLGILSGCKKNESGIVIPEQIEKYPLVLNHEWGYHTIIKNEYYNKIGGFDSSVTTDLGNTIEKVILTNQSLKNFNSLFLMEGYDTGTPQQRDKHYYLNDSSGLYGIAYGGEVGSSQVVVPKKANSHYLTLNDVMQYFKSRTGLLFENTHANRSDSIQYYERPRVVLVYPLSVGKTWTELDIPFHRDRIVTGKVDITGNNETIPCYEIVGKITEFNWVMKDYFSPNAGLVRRDIIADSSAITGPDSPDPIGYVRSTFLSVLVRKNF